MSKGGEGADVRTERELVALQIEESSVLESRQVLGQLRSLESEAYIESGSVQKSVDLRQQLLVVSFSPTALKVALEVRLAIKVAALIVVVVVVVTALPIGVAVMPTASTAIVLTKARKIAST